jgi:hypothetical protein
MTRFTVLPGLRLLASRVERCGEVLNSLVHTDKEGER